MKGSKARKAAIASAAGRPIAVSIFCCLFRSKGLIPWGIPIIVSEGSGSETSPAYKISALNPWLGSRNLKSSYLTRICCDDYCSILR